MTDSRTRRATLVGCGALALWSALALLTTAAGPIPPFQMTAMTFAIATALVLAKWRLRGESIAAHLALPAPIWALGVCGLFGYHALYFTALALAPPVEANLINYLWPLLIVLLTGLVLRERLHWWHVLGAGLGLAGAAVLVGGGAEPSAQHLLGYAAAFGSAAIWSLYSVLSRRAGAIGSDAVGGFCGATAALALACHLALEPTVWPQGAAWLAIAALGAGPVGLAFFLWDHGVKHGDIRALGALAYLTPLLSTMLLIAFGRAAPRWSTGLACALIVGGAVLAGRDMWRPRTR
jgi:drug/metabolite transporter (DMT)-like permease